jgi:GNAT superfamily N-acetyltransferase
MAFPLQAAVRTATLDDLPTVAEVLAEAFLHGDLAGWLIPHLDTRARIYRPYFAMLTEHTLTYGHVRLCGNGAAVACWYSIGDGPLPELPDYGRRLAEITAAFQPRFAALDQAMHDHHPYDQPHHYLALLAVHPDEQHRGLGSALLAHEHAELDATETSAYLEATGPRNRRLYARNGYRPRSIFHLANDGPPLYPMWRPPAASTRAARVTAQARSQQPECGRLHPVTPEVAPSRPTHFCG